MTTTNGNKIPALKLRSLHGVFKSEGLGLIPMRVCTYIFVQGCAAQQPAVVAMPKVRGIGKDTVCYGKNSNIRNIVE